jgi:hypothetical protein
MQMLRAGRLCCTFMSSAKQQAPATGLGMLSAVDMSHVCSQPDCQAGDVHCMLSQCTAQPVCSQRSKSWSRGRFEPGQCKHQGLPAAAVHNGCSKSAQTRSHQAVAHAIRYHRLRTILALHVVQFRLVPSAYIFLWSPKQGSAALHHVYIARHALLH